MIVFDPALCMGSDCYCFRNLSPLTAGYDLSFFLRGEWRK